MSGKALFATQGGGIAEEIVQGLVYHFVESPKDFPEMQVGDSVPPGWDLAPINEAARQSMVDDIDLDD